MARASFSVRAFTSFTVTLTQRHADSVACVMRPASVFGVVGKGISFPPYNGINDSTMGNSYYPCAKRSRTAATAVTTLKRATTMVVPPLKRA